MAAPQPVVEKVFHKLGGRTALGMDVFSDADLARVVHLAFTPRFSPISSGPVFPSRRFTTSSFRLGHGGTAK